MDFKGYTVVMLFLVGGIAFILITLLAGKILRPVRPNEEKLTTYESGEDPVNSAWGKFNVRFYVVALVFLLFEVELLFLFPWATVFANKEIIKETNGLWGWFTLVEMSIFIIILALGLFYAWAKGFLDWVFPEVKKNDFKGVVPMSRYDQFNDTIGKNDISGNIRS